MAETDKRAFDIALRASGPVEPDQERVVRIPNTLHLEELYLSPIVYDSIKDRVERIETVENIFSTDGNLKTF